MTAALHPAGTAAQLRAAQERWDNMAEPEPTDADAIREAIRLCDHYTGRAERALQAGDIDAARDLLSSAMRELGEVARAA
jgi:hypothetical protein